VSRPTKPRQDEWDVLVESLRFAVPLWIDELRDLTPEQRLARQVRAAKDVGHWGDALMFRAQSPAGRRTAARAFNALAEALAAAAYLPGGSSFRELHWCVPASPEAVRETNRRRTVVSVHLPDLEEDACA
jgi:hypothetical protein